MISNTTEFKNLHHLLKQNAINIWDVIIIDQSNHRVNSWYPLSEILLRRYIKDNLKLLYFKLLRWKCCHGNHSDISTIHLSLAELSLYYIWRFIRTTGIRATSLVAMVAYLPWQPHLHLNNSIVLSCIKFILGT